MHNISNGKNHKNGHNEHNNNSSKNDSSNNTSSNNNSVNNGPILSVRAFIENSQGSILILKRAKSENASEKWSLPGGIVNYTESPEKGLKRLIIEKTGLEISDLDFLNYQNSQPSEGGSMHCLNMYFKAKTTKTDDKIKLSAGFTEYFWVNPQQLKTYDLAFMGNDAIPFYEQSKRPTEDLLWTLSDEAGYMMVPITKKQLIDVQALPGFFIQMKKDLQVYEQVRKRLQSTLEIIQSVSHRGNEPIIAHIQSRVKLHESIIEKMIRKGQNGIPRHYTTFDDIAGVRAVVSFLKDVYTVRDSLLQYKEFKLIEEEDSIKNPKDTGYRALHLTFEVPIPGASFVPKCEVQIKTIYQHSWSNATHELTYKKNKSIPQTHLDQFRTLSDNLANADKIAEQLRHDIEHLDDVSQDTHDKKF